MTRIRFLLALLVCGGACLPSAGDAPVFVIDQPVGIGANQTRSSASVPLSGPGEYEIESIHVFAVNANTAEAFPGVRTYVTSSGGMVARSVDGGGKPDLLLSPGNVMVTCSRDPSPIPVRVSVIVTLRRVLQ